MSEELRFHVKSLSRFVYFVTDEEDRFLIRLRSILEKFSKHTFVFNAAHGLLPIDQILRDWKTHEQAVSTVAPDIHSTLEYIYKYTDQGKPKDDQGPKFYVLTDPERYFRDDMVIRRLLNLAHQDNNDLHSCKMVFAVGQRLVMPEKLSRYFQVVYDPGLTDESIMEVLGEVGETIRIQVPPNITTLCKGMTSFEVRAAVAQAIVRTKKDPVQRVEPKFLAEFRRDRLKKSDLVQLLDTTEVTFKDVGGGGRFKEWARKTKAVWTKAGQDAGLEPPRGILAVGPWGTGKSLATKALATEWSVPLIQLEMGRLRSSAVGETEANVYRAIRIIESIGPCIVWIDEAEKSLSGGQSSAQSDAGTGLRAIGILSTWLQETKTPVCLALTANSLKTLPVEFVNRMDERFFFDIPSEEERIEVIKIHMRKSGIDPSGYNLALLSEKANQMVGREIWQCIKAAKVDTFDKGEQGINEEILEGILDRKPRIVRTMVDELREILDWVGYDPDLNEGIRARYASEPNRNTGSLKLVS